MGDVDGHVDPRFHAVAEAFVENFRSGLEIGAACAVVVDGALVVDVWDGHVRPDGPPWVEDTLVETRSATKGVTALCLHLLVDRGLVDLDAPVRRYWPGLRADPLVSHVLEHSAGIPVIDGPLAPGALTDWGAMAQAVAAQEPSWDPGVKHGYHGVTFGWLLGEVVRRVTGSGVGAFVQREVAPVVGGDYFIGTPRREHHRIAPMFVSPVAEGRPAVPAPAAGPPNELAARMMAPMYPPVSPRWNSPEFWEAEIPVSNGICTARSLARIYGELSEGGGRFVRPEGAARMAEERCGGVDAVLGIPVRRSLGFELTPLSADDGRPPHAFGHPGAGGFVAFADPDARLGFAYVKNAGPPVPGQPDPRAPAIIRALYDGLQ